MPCRPGIPEPEPERGAHLATLGINGAIGGITAGVRRHARGGSFWRGFLHGAVGGAAVYGGKWLSAEPFWGAGLAGRQVAAVGASVVHNASEDRPLLEELMLPVGTARVVLRPDDPLAIRVRLDLIGTAISAYRALSPGSHFDLQASLSAGGPVFLTDRPWHPGWHGNNTGGVIVLLREDVSRPTTSLEPNQVFAHDRVHLLQYDQLAHTVGAPVERWLLRRVPGGSRLAQHVDLGLVMVPVLLLNAVIPYETRPWEREAHLLSGT
jgi:hypothetical protein